VRITAATAFDPPPGDGQEDNARLGALYDGNPNTAWSTEEYRTSQFGNVKQGVGVYLTLDAPHALRSLVVDSKVTGWSASVYVAGRPAAALAGWGKPVARFTVNGPTTTVALGGATGADVLVWITNLGPPNPNAAVFAYRVDISELSVRS
jgi:hypothetical protein